MDSIMHYYSKGTPRYESCYDRVLRGITCPIARWIDPQDHAKGVEFIPMPTRPSQGDVNWIKRAYPWRDFPPPRSPSPQPPPLLPPPTRTDLPPTPSPQQPPSPLQSPSPPQSPSPQQVTSIQQSPPPQQSPSPYTWTMQTQWPIPSETSSLVVQALRLPQPLQQPPQPPRRLRRDQEASGRSLVQRANFFNRHGPWPALWPPTGSLTILRYCFKNPNSKEKLEPYLWKLFKGGIAPLVMGTQVLKKTATVLSSKKYWTKISSRRTAI